jgi:hypothetical protein
MSRTYKFIEKKLDPFQNAYLWHWQIFEDGNPTENFIAHPSELHPDEYESQQISLRNQIKDKFIAMGFNEEEANMLSGHSH